MNYEIDYMSLIEDILLNGEERRTRNATTIMTCFKTLTVDTLQDGYFPLITGRKMYHKGIIGELAAFLHMPNKLSDFTDRGCNYWAKWADKDDKLNVDYGNKWQDWNGVNQLRDVVETLKTNPYDRRMLITSWDPSNLKKLSLPCCHLLYQFVVRDNQLDMIWYQRSADVMIGVPSDIVLGAMLLALVADETEYCPGKLHMVFGDAHIYKDHIDGAKEYISRRIHTLPTYCFDAGLFQFEPYNFKLNNYEHGEPIIFRLHG